MDHLTWDTFLPDELHCRASEKDRYEALFSLMVYLDIPLAQFLMWFFSVKELKVRQRAGRFLSFHPNYDVPFAPKAIWDLWNTFPQAVPHLHEEIVAPCAHDMALRESDLLLADSSLHMSVRESGIQSLKASLDPFTLVVKFWDIAPFFFGLLMTMSAAPNAYQQRKARRFGEQDPSVEDSEEGDLFEEDGLDDPDSKRTFKSFAGWERDFQHFRVKALVPVVFIFSMLTFVRNSRVNILSLPMGLFLRIGGADKRIISVLNKMGLCVSYDTIERLKSTLTKDAIHLAQKLVSSTSSWFAVFDNLNVYLRKFEQRLTNRNTMLSLTNSAIIALPDITADSLELKPFLDMRGFRSKAVLEDLEISPAECNYMQNSMTAIVAQLLAAFCPGSSAWPDYAGTKKRAASLMPFERPLPPKKTETYPFGVFDIDEGSKRGCIQVLQTIQSKAKLSDDDWVTVVRIIMGDWLTVSNIHASRKERADDYSALEQLLNVKELSALWHYGLNALHMIIKTHLGNTIDDPGSLASHKGLLGRVWDVNKPDYAAAKSLVRHSLIARLLDIVMEIKGFTQYSELSQWRPSFHDLREIATQIVAEFATAGAGSDAQQAGDDWFTHSIYFIRDSLLFLVFEQYVSFADAGGILRVLKFWAYAFRGAGMTNYARECLEVLMLWKYELPAGLRIALEHSWFVNKSGLPGRQHLLLELVIYADNPHFQRVFIAQGSGVTPEYMANKGSACVEAFQEITHRITQFTGTHDVSRRHKEAQFHLDVRALMDHMRRKQLHKLSLSPRAIAATVRRAKQNHSGAPVSAIADVIELGAEQLFSGGFKEFIMQTTFEPALGSAEDTIFGRRTVYSHPGFNLDDEENLQTGDDSEMVPGSGALGGGGDFD